MTSLNQEKYLDRLIQLSSDIPGDFGCRDRLMLRLSSSPKDSREDQFLTSVGGGRDLPQDTSSPLYELSFLVADIALELYGTDFLTVLPDSRKSDLKKHYGI